MLLYAPFFLNYANVGASGVGLVREGDDLSLWLLIWGFLGFLVVSWLLWSATQPARRVSESAYGARSTVLAHPAGIERAVSLGLRQFDRLPRMVYLGRVLSMRPRLSYLLMVGLIPLSLIAAGLALWWGAPCWRSACCR